MHRGSTGFRASSQRNATVPRASSQGQPVGDTDEEKRQAVISLAISLGSGAVLSHLGVGVDPALPDATQGLSAMLGCSYFVAWSLSFYPQVIDNAQRRSVEGLSADYLVYSLLGYAAYTAYTGALYLNPGVQAAYMAAHGGSAPDVQLTDVLFAGHALLLTLVTLYQCVLYGDGSSSKSGGGGRGGALATSRGCNLTAAAVFAAVAAYCGHISSTCGSGDCDAWLPLLYLLGFIKVSMTLIKYTPQALLNAQRCSTEGWSINNVLLDLAGGLLSFGQVGLNAAARGDLSVITGSPTKLAISLLSLAFDVLFALQHYVWYAGGSSSSSSQEQQQPGAAAAAAAAALEQQQQRQRQPPPAAAAGGSSTTSSGGGGRRPAPRMVAVAVRAASNAARGVWRR